MYESPRDRLRKAGNRLAKARKQQEEAMAEVNRAIKDAGSREVSITDISRLTGVSRQHIYTVLGMKKDK